MASDTTTPFEQQGGVAKLRPAGDRSQHGSGHADGQDRSGGVSSLTDVLESIDDQLDGEDELAVGDILDAFGSRAFGPLLVAPSLLALTPVGAVPTVPTMLGVLILLVAGQHAFGRSAPWVPKRILKRSVSKNKWKAAHKKSKPWAKRIDAVIGPRLTALADSPADRVIAVLACACAVLMPPLELVPFAVILPGAAVLCLGLALVARDGLLTIFGSTTLLITAGLAAYWLV